MLKLLASDMVGMYSGVLGDNVVDNVLTNDEQFKV